MEKFRIEPCIHTGTADTDRKVTLEEYALRMRILANL
jgi:hypothetical protein